MPQTELQYVVFFGAKFGRAPKGKYLLEDFGFLEKFFLQAVLPDGTTRILKSVYATQQSRYTAMPWPRKAVH